MIFDLNDPALTAKIVKKVREIFKVFEAQHRFKLLEDTLRFQQAEGELVLYFVYHDLESDEAYPFSRLYKGTTK
jgi:hypothetical protein